MAASTQGLSARLHGMETRLDCTTDTLEQFRDRLDSTTETFEQVRDRLNCTTETLEQVRDRLGCATNILEKFHDRITRMEDATKESAVIHHAFLDMMYQLQPLGEATPATTFCKYWLTLRNSKLSVATQQCPQPSQHCPR